jgi:hypothetical protein
VIFHEDVRHKGEVALTARTQDLRRDEQHNVSIAEMLAASCGRTRHEIRVFSDVIERFQTRRTSMSHPLRMGNADAVALTDARSAEL